jgi:hypothetical protein
VCGTFIRDGIVCPGHGSPAGDDQRAGALSIRRTVEELPLEDLAVPRAYQRRLKEHLVRRIIREFDADLVGLLVVVRDEQDALWILDGQHRWLALVGLGHRTALCEVLHHVPLARQATIFSGRNSSRVAPHPRDAFRADHVANHPHVTAIMDVLDRYGYRPPYGNSRASADRFVCVSALREVHSWGVLEPAVAVIRQAWRADELATQAPILLGLAAVLRLYPRLPADELARRLERHSAAEILRLARASCANSRERRLWVHVAAVVVDLHNHGRRAAHRLPAASIPIDAARRWKQREVVR